MTRIRLTKILTRECAMVMVAGIDPVAIDAYVAKAWWDLDATQMSYLQLATLRGLGLVDFKSLAIRVSDLG